MSQEVLLECNRCNLSLRAEVTVVECAECGYHHPACGTLTGDWLARWINSHQEPRVYLQ